MAIPGEPRQAMINMMYLVLTALLALNVSAEILNAFDIVNNGIKNSTQTIKYNSVSLLSSLSLMADSNLSSYDPKAVTPYHLAAEAQAIADQTYESLEKYKLELKRKAGLEYDRESGDSILTDKRNTHLPTWYFVNEKKGYEIQKMINESRQKFLDLYPDHINSSGENDISLHALDDNVTNKANENRDWVEYNFYDVPVIAAITVLSKLQNDVRKAESDIIEYFFRDVNADVYEMDVVEANVIPEKSVVTTGATYRAEILVSAFSSIQQPVAFEGKVDRSKLENKSIEVKGEFRDIPIIGEKKELGIAENGKIIYERPATGTGTRKITGVVGIYNPKTDITTYYPFENEYKVSPPSAVVSPVWMNVLYIGVDNPLAVSVPGFQPEQVQVSISQGSLHQTGKNDYKAVVTEPGQANVEVTVLLEDGNRKIMGNQPFRVKRIPDPKVLFGISSGPVIRVSEARAIPGLVPKSDNFPFELNYKIIDFEVMVNKKNTNLVKKLSNEGMVFNENVQDLINDLEPGDRLWFDNIRVLAPDKTVRKMNLSFRIL